MTLENLEGNYYVPGTELDTSDGMWKEIQDGTLDIAWNLVLNCFQHLWPYRQ